MLEFLAEKISIRSKVIKDFYALEELIFNSRLKTTYSLAINCVNVVRIFITVQRNCSFYHPIFLSWSVLSQYFCLFVFAFFKIGCLCIAFAVPDLLLNQAGLRLTDPPASASLSAGITGIRYHTGLNHLFLNVQDNTGISK